MSHSLTPLMRQHREIKAQYPDAILLFRVGDFYETFGDDAVRTAAILHITLTKRNSQLESSQHLAGFPHHALDTYLHKLVNAGTRVAICEQMEDPKLAKGIVKRAVTELITPGTNLADKALDSARNNFLCALAPSSTGVRYGVAFADVSTGDFFTSEGNWEYVDKLMQSFKPSEVLVPKRLRDDFRAHFRDTFFMYVLEDWVVEERYAREQLLDYFGVHSLKGFGVEDKSLSALAAGMVVHYVNATRKSDTRHFSNLRTLQRESSLWIDACTMRNLEILTPTHEDGRSLLSILDETVSPMGARLLKRWIALPLCHKQDIEARLETVHFFSTQPTLAETFLIHIKACGDIERLSARLATSKITPREILFLADALHSVREIKALAEQQVGSPFLSELAENLDPCEDLKNTIYAQLDAQYSTQKTGFIRAGVREDLDNYRAILHDTKTYLANYQQSESERYGIPSLKIHYNNVFGYYLEVSNTYKSRVPAHWTRKQTLVSAERYTTEELREREEKIRSAEESASLIEQEVFDNLCRACYAAKEIFQHNALWIARLDCLISFARLATRYSYTRPVLDALGTSLILRESRHPIIERTLATTDTYIANDITLGADEGAQIMLLTGPNMSGKSALLRQCALIILMAHIGCYVPCAHAVIPLTDKIFTRVGASDNLSAGESTFMVEMNETASIVNGIGKRSLVLLDEVGRGTSTYDGMAIAMSVLEFLHAHADKPKVLFATHYHELAEMQTRCERIKNFHLSYSEQGEQIIFLRKLCAGASVKSFGIYVARMAGFPASILARASEILRTLETEDKKNEQDLEVKKKKGGGVNKCDTQELSSFPQHIEQKNTQQIMEILREVDTDHTTPMAALQKLIELKNKLLS